MTWRTSSATFGDWDEVELNCWREDQTTDVVEDPIIWALRCPAVRTLNFRRKLHPGVSWGFGGTRESGFAPCCPASSILAGLASISFAGSPPRPGLVAGQRWCGSWGRQTPG